MLVVKSVDQLFIDEHVLTACFVFQVLHLNDELLIGRQKWQFGVPVAGHQRFTNEYFTGAHRVNSAEVDATAVVDHQAIQRGTLQGRDLCGFFLPMRIQQLFLEQVPCDLLHPLRLDVGNAAAKQARGFHQLGSHNPTARFFAQLGAGVSVEADAARAQIGLLVFGFVAQVAQQPAEHRQVQLLVAGRLAVDLPTLLANDAVQLRVDVTPFAHAADVDEVLTQQVFVLAVRELVFRRMTATRITQPFPQLQITGELAFLVIKLGVRLVCLRLLVHRPVAHVLDAERTCNDHHLVERLPVAGLKNHAAHARV